MCVSQAAWVRTQVHFSPDYTTPLSNFKVLMSQEWGGRRRSTPWDRLSQESPHKRRRRGISLLGFAAAISPTAVYSLQGDEWRLKYKPRAKKKSISPQWGGKHKEEEGGKAKQQGTVQNSPATALSPKVCSSLCVKASPSHHIAWVMIEKISNINIVDSSMFTEKPAVANQMNLGTVTLSIFYWNIYQPHLLSNLWKTGTACPPNPRKLTDMYRSLKATLAYLLLATAGHKIQVTF